MSKFARYRVFSAIVENGSLASASDVLLMSPSSVSKHLSKLEEELGVNLVDRNTHQLTITESGMVFYDRVKRILSEIEEAEECVQQKKLTLDGVITISIPQILLKTPFLSVLSEFNEEYPEIRFDIRVSNSMDDLVERKMDFAFRIGELKDSQYIAIPISKLNIVFCASPHYVEKHKDLSLGRLIKDRQLIVPGFLSASSNSKLSKLDPMLSKGKKSDYHQTDDALTVDEMAIAGLGVCPTFDIAVAEDIERGRLVKLSISQKFPKQAICMVFHKRDHMPLRMRTFKDFIKERLPEALEIS